VPPLLSPQVKEDLLDMYETGVDYINQLEAQHNAPVDGGGGAGAMEASESEEEPDPEEEAWVDDDAPPKRRRAAAKPKRAEPKVPESTRESSRRRSTGRVTYADADSDEFLEEYVPAPSSKKSKKAPSATSPAPAKKKATPVRRERVTQDYIFESGSIVWSKSLEGNWWWPCVIIDPDGAPLKKSHVMVIEFGKNLQQQVSLDSLMAFSDGKEDFCEVSAFNEIPDEEIPDFLTAVDDAETAHNEQVAAAMEMMTDVDDQEAKIEKILADRPGVEGGEMEYLIKWENRSHIHNTWNEKSEVDALARVKLRNYRAKQREINHADDFEDDAVTDGVRHAWGEVARVLSHRGGSGKGNASHYLCLWGELPYTDATWEVVADLSPWEAQIESYWAREIVAADRFAGRSSGKQVSRKPENFEAFPEHPSWLQGQLHPYQLEGVNWIRASWYKETNVILADEMGLGKTIQSSSYLLSLFRVEQTQRPFLIVVPLSTITNWERELALWAPEMHTVVYMGSADARTLIRNYEWCTDPGLDKGKPGRGDCLKMGSTRRPLFDVLLISYELAAKDENHLRKIDFECLVVDEGHRLKNRESKLFQCLQSFKWRHGLLLTGTPLQNNLEELYNLMHFLAPKKFHSLDEYERILGGGGGGEEDAGAKESMVHKLHEMLRPHMLRRMKADVKLELPPKAELIIQCDLTPYQIELYKAILTKNYGALKATTGGQTSLMNVVMELRKVCNHPLLCIKEDLPRDNYNDLLITGSGKMLLLERMLDKLEEGGHRVLIFSQMTRMLDLLGDRLSDRHLRFERLDGSVSNAERSARIDRFNKNKEIFCFLLSTRAGGLGINLATADTVIIFDSDWNPHADTQALARAHRIGQQNKVMIYRLVTRNTVEERVMQRAKKKMMLEQIVVRKMKADKSSASFKKGELDDILRYGAQDMFKETKEGEVDQVIQYDDAALANMLDRTRNEVATDQEDTEQGGWLSSFKVANYDTVKKEGEEGGALVKEMEVAEDIDGTVGTGDYWDGLLGTGYEAHMETQGRGKRERKTLNPNLFDDLEEEYEGSDAEDDGQRDIDEDGKAMKKRKVDCDVLDARGRIHGFSTRERKTFKELFMKNGLWKHRWKEFQEFPALKHKPLSEVAEYGELFLRHLEEDPEESREPGYFADGVPKEKLDTKMAMMHAASSWLVHRKLLECESDSFRFKITDTLQISTMHRIYESSRGVYRPVHDVLLLRALRRHGHGSWKEIITDETCEPLIQAIYRISNPAVPRTGANAVAVKSYKVWPDRVAYNAAERRRKAIIANAKAERKVIPEENGRKVAILQLMSRPHGEIKAFLDKNHLIRGPAGDKLDMLASLQAAVASGKVELPAVKPEEELDFDTRLFLAQNDIGVLMWKHVEAIFFKKRIAGLGKELDPAAKAEACVEEWRSLPFEEKLVYMDRWLGTAEPGEYSAVSSAVEDGMEIGVWGSKEWRQNTLAELRKIACDPEQYGLTVFGESGKLAYRTTEWMRKDQLVWIATPTGWWPAQIIEDGQQAAKLLAAQMLGDKVSEEGKDAPASTDKGENPVWVKQLQTNTKVKLQRTAAHLLPFRACFAKLSVSPPSNPQQRSDWSSALSQATSTEGMLHHEMIDKKLAEKEKRAKDFNVEAAAKNHLTSFIRNRSQTLLEALLHEYLDATPDADITLDELQAQKAEEQLQLGECLCKVLDMFPKDLFLFLHQHSDERRQGDLTNLWHRLSNTERGILTARQVASVLMRLLDVDLVKRVVAEYQGAPSGPMSATEEDGCPVSKEWLAELNSGGKEWISQQKELDIEAQIESERLVMKEEHVKWDKSKAFEIHNRLANPAVPSLSTSCFARFSLKNHLRAFRDNQEQELLKVNTVT